jgi:transposase
MAGRWELTDEQWEMVEPILRPARRQDNRGRPWQDTRAVLHGVLWILGSGAQWSEMPAKYPPYQTCHRRFQQRGKKRQIGPGAGSAGAAFAQARKAETGRGVCGRDVRERQKGGFAVGPTRRGKGTKIVAIASGDGLPLAVSVESASPAECQLVEAVLAGCFLRQLPERLIGDKAYDSDALDEQMKQYGVEMISPHRSNRKHRTQDGRPLRRYRRRWKIERLFAWMHNYRRLVTRWEYHIENFLGFVQLACLLMLLRHL